MKQNISFIYGHPRKDSLCHSILKTLTTSLESLNYSINIYYASDIDYTNEQNSIATIQKQLLNSQIMIYIYPVWWFTCPSILKKFIDSLFTQGFAFKSANENKDYLKKSFKEDGVKYPENLGTLTHKSICIRTHGGSDNRRFTNVDMSYESLVQKPFEAILRYCGISKILNQDIYSIRFKSKTDLENEIQAIKNNVIHYIQKD